MKTHILKIELKGHIHMGSCSGFGELGVWGGGTPKIIDKRKHLKELIDSQIRFFTMKDKLKNHKFKIKAILDGERIKFEDVIV